MLHHGFKKGKRVLVILHTGEKIVGKFKDSTSKYIELEKRTINWSDIRATTIYKDRKWYEKIKVYLITWFFLFYI